MADVLDVAKYILNTAGKMSTWKLQKLCYYSQAWAIAWTERPIFQEEFQAWANGPVCPELFHKHHGMFMIDTSEFPYGTPENLTADEKDTINIILRDYGDMEPYALRELTHSEAPWREARVGLADGAYSQHEITKKSMGEYYGSL